MGIIFLGLFLLIAGSVLIVISLQARDFMFGLFLFGLFVDGLGFYSFLRGIKAYFFQDILNELKKITAQLKDTSQN